MFVVPADGSCLGSMVFREHPADDVFVDIQAKGMRNLLRDAGTANAGIARLTFVNRHAFFGSPPSKTRKGEDVVGFSKGHIKFTTLDLKEGFQNVPGYPPGFTERIIAGSLDEKSKVGNRTRVLRIEPGAFSTVPFVHDYWEEVFLITGDLICGSDGNGKGGEQFKGPTYCVRPPGVYHGPFASKTRCYLLENTLLRREMRASLQDVVDC